MGIIQLPIEIPAQVGVLPATKKMVTTDNLATITTAGYLNQVDLQSNPIDSTDVLTVLYSFNLNTNVGTLGFFTVSITNGIITLINWANPGDVLLPVTSGHLAVFNGITGQIHDSGYLPSNAAKTKVVMANGAVTVGHVASFADVNGTVQDGGVLGTAAAKAASDATKASLASVNGATVVGHIATFSDIAGTIQDGGALGQAATKSVSDNTKASVASVSAAVVSGNLAKFADVNGTVADQGVAMKSVAKAVVAGGAAAQTITDAFCTSASSVISSWNDTTNPVSIQTVAAGNGSFVVTSSGDPGASHLNYVIFK